MATLIDYPLLEIVKNIPVPPHRSLGLLPRFPFESMEVRDSFLAPNDPQPLVAAYARAFARKHPGWKFTTRKTSEGTRCWRIS